MRDHATMYDSRRSRPDDHPDARERLAEAGIPALSDRDLVAILLGTGTREKGVDDLAAEVLDLVDTLRSIPDIRRLEEIRGLGRAKACTLVSAFELGKRFHGAREKRISSPGDFYPMISHWADRKQERFISASLNGAHEIITLRVVTVGLVNRTVIHPREVFADAIADRACAVIVAHNHPSGRLDPSPEDVEMTRRLGQAGTILGVTLLDHLVFSASGYCSFVEHGLFVPG